MTSRRTQVVALLGLVVCAGVHPAVGQEAKKGEEIVGPTALIFGAAYCVKCHAHPEDYQRENVICRMNEALTWETHDKHRKAFSVLNGSRGRAIGTALQIQVTEDRACLSCHSVIDWKPGVPNPIARQQFDREADGVSCVACHGAFRNWVVEHSLYETPEWGKRSRKEKERDFGMVDLWDPVTRARKCVSCHVGNTEEGKVLSHAMFAAGHPPLPGVEVSTLSQAMPNHWEYLREKLARLGEKKPVVRARIQRDHPDLKRLEHTELVAVSGLVPLRESLALFLGQVEGPAPPRPDYARFDCYACHHDLKAPSWRQARGFAAAPGRPPAPAWPTALVPLGVEAAGPDRSRARLDEFPRKLRDWHEALGARPFGARDQTIPAAKALIGWADEVIGNLGKATCDRDLALRLLDRIVQTAQADLHDYDSARQVFWAYQVIFEELEPKPRADDPVPGMLKALDEAFQFRLPSAGKQERIEKSLTNRLKAVADFDPERFRGLFAKLAEVSPRK